MSDTVLIEYVGGPYDGESRPVRRSVLHMDRTLTRSFKSNKPPHVHLYETYGPIMDLDVASVVVSYVGLVEPLNDQD